VCHGRVGDVSRFPLVNLDRYYCVTVMTNVKDVSCIPLDMRLEIRISLVHVTEISW
jgi:hypothetical protein